MSAICWFTTLAMDFPRLTLKKEFQALYPTGRVQSLEDSGKREIAGIETVGTRKTTIMNSDTLGNDRPLTYMSEYWRADKLAINLLSIRSSPYFGKQTFTVSDLSDTDPDAQLFNYLQATRSTTSGRIPRISHCEGSPIFDLYGFHPHPRNLGTNSGNSGTDGWSAPQN